MDTKLIFFSSISQTLLKAVSLFWYIHQRANQPASRGNDKWLLNNVTKNVLDEDTFGMMMMIIACDDVRFECSDNSLWISDQSSESILLPCACLLLKVSLISTELFFFYFFLCVNIDDWNYFHTHSDPFVISQVPI